MLSPRSPSHDFTSGPLITIAIPTYNRAPLLKNCILSALSQTYKHFEILVSDNGSTDNTAEMLTEFQDLRLRVLRQDCNIGQLPNWNTCLAEARGEYIVFVSDDDEISPWFLERCMALVEREPQIPIVLTLGTIYRPRSDERLPPTLTRFETGIWVGVDLLEEIFKGNLSTFMCCVLIRTNALRARGGFPTDMPFSADTAAWLPLLLKGPAGFVNEACATYCIHDGATTYTLPIDTLIADERRVVELVSALAEQSIEDPLQRLRIKSSAKIYLARCIGNIFVNFSRRRESKIKQLLPLIWLCRRDLMKTSPVYVFRSIKPIALMILPTSIANFIRRVKLRYWP